MHTFAYARVSTTAQTTENQIKEIEDRGYTLDTIYQDVISGKVPTAKRPEFSKLIDTAQRMKGEKRPDILSREIGSVDPFRRRRNGT